MYAFDKIKNIIIEYEEEKLTREEALDEICGICFARSIRIWDVGERNGKQEKDSE